MNSSDGLCLYQTMWAPHRGATATPIIRCLESPRARFSRLSSLDFRLDSGGRFWPVARKRQRSGEGQQGGNHQPSRPRCRLAGHRKGGRRGRNSKPRRSVVCRVRLSVMCDVFEKCTNRAADRKTCAFDAA